MALRSQYGNDSGRTYTAMGNRSRSVAFRAVLVLLVFVGGTAVGSVFPEFGNVLAAYLGLWSHSFNAYFLAVGIISLCVALFLGYKDRS